MTASSQPSWSNALAAADATVVLHWRFTESVEEQQLAIRRVCLTSRFGQAKEAFFYCRMTLTARLAGVVDC